MTLVAEVDVNTSMAVSNKIMCLCSWRKSSQDKDTFGSTPKQGQRHFSFPQTP